MAIQKRAGENGVQIFDVYVQASVHGRRIQKRKRGFESLKAARQAENLLRAELLLEKGQPERLTWNMWLERHLKQMKLTYRSSTVENYSTTLGKWVTPVFRDTFLDEITQDDVFEKVISKMTESTGATKLNLMVRMRRVFEAAVKSGFIRTNPADGIKIKVIENKQAILNATEVDKLLHEAKINRHRFYEVWAFAVFSGMRSGEMYALKWSDIDLENRRIYVNKAWSSKAGIGSTKSGKNRVVPVGDQLYKLLLELKIRGGFSDIELGPDHVLPRIQEWQDGAQAERLRQFCTAIGITSVKFHDLRATFITQLLLKGVPLAQVMSVVGHTELKTTTRYLRVSGADLDGVTNHLSYSLPEEHLAKVIGFPGRAAAE